jgi:hypothetical protein
LPLAGAIRVTVPSLWFATQTNRPATATANGSPPM